MHNGSVGFFVQSTGGCVVPVVQLFTHVVPAPGPPEVFVLFVGRHVTFSFGELHIGDGTGVVRCSFASSKSQSFVLRFLSGSVLAVLSGRSHGSPGGLKSTHL